MFGTNETYTGKVAMVTGASSGIGEALARELSARGFSVALLARRRERLESLREQLVGLGGKALAIPCDVTQEQDLPNAVRQIKEAWGRIDLVIANAGFGVVGSVETVKIADYERQFQTNVWGVLRTVKAVLTDLKATKGRLALIGSLNGYVCLPGSSAYGMSKFAVRALGDALFYELKSEGVSVTHIAPGFVESEIRQVDNQGQWHERARDKVPEWIRMRTPKAAHQIVSAILKRKREAVITGHAKLGIFLQRHLPWLLSFFVLRTGLKARSQP